MVRRNPAGARGVLLGVLARLIVLVSVTAAVTVPASAAASPCHVHARLPDRACTPGTVLPSATKEPVCKVGYTKRVRNVPERVKNLVYQRYGITRHPRGTYEMDHLIPLELGGSNKQKNLFPQAAEPRPGFHEKDLLENQLHASVCDGRMKLKTAQRLIATNWLKTYRALVY